MDSSIKTTGIVKEVVDSRNFKIVLKDGMEISATLSSKARLYLSYDIVEGEEVPLVLSPYDKTRGRITPRHWQREAT